MFQVRAVSTHFLIVGAVQACTRSSRLAAFGATSTISRFSAPRRSAVRRPCRENLQKRCHWRPPACVTLSPPSRHSSAASHCLQPEDNKRRRCLVQRSTRLIKNEKQRARSPPQAARSSQEDRHSVRKSTSTSLDRLGSYHMKIVVVGGTGLIGSKLVALLRQRDQEVLAASPDSGVNTLTGEGLAEALVGAQVVVDLANSPSFEDTAVMNFFETAGRNLLAAEAAAGVRHHVALSIVGTDRLPDSGYLRAKMAQERLIKASGIPYTILRSTQFFEFMGRVADSFSDGKTVRVPPALVQPISSNDVVTALADLVLGAPGNDTLEVAGPEKLRFDELIRRVLANNHDARKVTSDVHARYFGTELNDQSLVPASTAPRIGTTRFESWLARSTSQT